MSYSQWNYNESDMTEQLRLRHYKVITEVRIFA